MRKLNRFTAAAAIFCAAVSVLRADVLEKVPDSALVAIKVAALETTSAKVAALAKDFGVDAFAPPLQDPLGALEQEANVSKGLNRKGDMAFVFFDPKATGAGGDQNMLLLIPVSNYGEFLSNFEGATAEGGVTQVTFGGDEKPSFVADWDGYAAVSPTRDLVAKPTATLKITGFSAKQAAAQDFLLYANFGKITPSILPEFEENVTEALAEIESGDNQQIDPKYKPLIKTTAQQVFGFARTFLNDTQSATIGLNIVDAGINTTFAADFKPDSYLAKVAASFKGTDKPLTVGLPQLRYLAYGGATYEPAAVSKVIDDLTAPILAELNKIEGEEEAKKIAGSLKAALNANTGAVTGVVAPTKIGDDAFFQQVTVYKGGGKDFKASFDSTGSFIKNMFASVEPREGEPKPSLEITPNARTVDGVVFDKIVMDIEQPKDSPEAVQAAQMMTIFYGTEGMSYSYAAVGDDFVLANSAKDATIASFLKAAKANDDSIGKLEYVKAVTAELPKSRMYELYVALDEMVNAGVGVANEFGLPVQMQLPPELPPMGITLGAEESAFRFDVHLPRSTIQSIIAAGMQAAMQMRGGGGGPAM